MRYFVAGTEVSRFFDTSVAAGIPWSLVSYYYLRNKKAAIVKTRKKEHPEIDTFIDSGAFTLMKKESVTKSEAFNYLLEYVAWLKKYKKYIFAAVELDLDLFFGLDTVLEWRKKYFEPLEKEGLQMVYVYRSTMPIEIWLDMVKKYRYVAISGVKDFTPPKLNSMMVAAQKYGTRVHGLGLSNWQIWIAHPWTSVDSSVTGDTKVWVRKKGASIANSWYEKIERLYNYLPTERQSTEFESVKETTDFEALTMDEHCNLVWSNLSAVIRHKVTKSIYTLHFKIGESIRVTGDHSVYTLDDKKQLVPTRADGLVVGDSIVGCELIGECIDFWIAVSRQIVKINVTVNDGLPINVYDLSVPGYQKFVGNNVVLHNTTYKACELFGETHLFVGNRLLKLRLKDKKQRIRYRNEIESLGLDWEKINNDEAPEILRWNILTWKKIIDHVNKMWGERGYYRFYDMLPTPAEVLSLNRDELQKLSGKLLNDSTVESEEEWESLRVATRNAVILAKKDPAGLDELREDKEHVKKIAESLLGEGEGEVEDLLTELGVVYRQNFMLRAGVIKRDKPKEREQPALESSPIVHLQERPAIQTSPGAPLGNQNARKHGIYSKRMPNYVCNTCAIRDLCPEYKADSICAFLEDFRANGISSVDEVVEYVEDNIRLRHERALMNAMIERAQGGVIDPNVSNELVTLSETAVMLARLKMDRRGGESLTVRGGPGILAALFGKSPAKEPEEIKSVDVSVSGGENSVKKEEASLLPKESSVPTVSEEISISQPVESPVPVLQKDAGGESGNNLPSP